MTLIRQIYTDFFKCDFTESKICENLLHQCYLCAKKLKTK